MSSYDFFQIMIAFKSPASARARFVRLIRALFVTLRLRNSKPCFLFRFD